MLEVWREYVLVKKLVFFFFHDTSTTKIYTYLHTLSQHDALPIYRENTPGQCLGCIRNHGPQQTRALLFHGGSGESAGARSEEHTSELQSLMRISYAVVCLKKKNATMS